MSNDGTDLITLTPGHFLACLNFIARNWHSRHTG